MSAQIAIQTSASVSRVENTSSRVFLIDNPKDAALQPFSTYLPTPTHPSFVPVTSIFNEIEKSSYLAPTSWPLVNIPRSNT